MADQFDLVLVHGDPSFVSLDETYPLAGELGEKLRYTGIVSAEPGELQGEPHDVVVSAGGGIVGTRLLRCAVQARQRSALRDANWCLITGPNIDPAVRDELAHDCDDRLQLVTTRPDFRALLNHAKLSISQAGYNTAADVLRAGCKSIMVPFAAGGETEQSLRAARLAEADRVTVIPEAELNPDRLIRAIDSEVARQPAAELRVDLNGADNAAKIVLNAVLNRP